MNGSCSRNGITWVLWLEGSRNSAPDGVSFGDEYTSGATGRIISVRFALSTIILYRPSSFGKPSSVAACPCGSVSSTSTLRPRIASPAATWVATVDLPVPPFILAIESTSIHFFLNPDRAGLEQRPRAAAPRIKHHFTRVFNELAHIGIACLQRLCEFITLAKHHEFLAHSGNFVINAAIVGRDSIVKQALSRAHSHSGRMLKTVTQRPFFHRYRTVYRPSKHRYFAR